MTNDSKQRRLVPLPDQRIRQIVGPLARFLHIEAASGGVLVVMAAFALFLANSEYSSDFLNFWETDVSFSFGEFIVSHSLHHWINDGLMATFFFVVGLEVKRELVLGELRDPQRAMLPVAAAFGGMIVPAGIFLYVQWGQPNADGWGIPMATDIAFVVGCMALLGSRVPSSLRVLLLTLAIADDIGAILVIAFGYSNGVEWGALLVGFLGIGSIAVLARLGMRSILVYTLIGFGVWIAFHASGVHATIAGVILGLQTPAESWLNHSFVGKSLREASEFLHGDDEPLDVGISGNRTDMLRQMEITVRESVSPLDRLLHMLHPWVSFGIMPIFAFANAGVVIQPSYLFDGLSVAVALGLLLGKPIGIVSAAWLAVKVGVAKMPSDLPWSMLVGGGFLGGIGFTMALFVAGLAIDGPHLHIAKVGILSGSVCSAIVGMSILYFLGSPSRAKGTANPGDASLR